MVERHNLRIDGARLWDSLMQMAKIGGTPKGGCNRQALTAEDAEGRALFRRWTEAAGCTVTVDRLGSMFARREGLEDLPPVIIGSHLDTQPTGGKFDGVLGVLAGLELIRCLDEAGIRTRRPIEIANWTNEEGCRFAPAMLASAVFAGLLAPDAALDTRDAAGFRLGDELVKHGQNGEAAVGGRKIGAYLELHIEQGPVLEAANQPLGVVTSIASIQRFSARVTGEAGHAGTVPMPYRHDALAAAADMVLAVERIARARPGMVGTVGIIGAEPGAVNVIPGEVRFSLDLRAPNDEDRKAGVAEVLAELDAIAKRRGVTLALAAGYEEAAALCHPAIKDGLAAAIRMLGHEPITLSSGAGHDAMSFEALCPMGMLFLRCKGGISHNPAESITEADADAALAAMLAFVRALDPARLKL